MNSEQLARPTRLARWIDGLNAFGPIFSKELRVASRRKRNYVLRALYLTILTVIVVLSWYSVMDQYHYSKVNRVAQMSQVGISLLLVVAWFQFGALQLVAPVLTSSAISDEISHRTLGALMMTPINSLQIVVGKLFSRVLIVVLLLATSLPMLAVIRIFGGIEWRLVLAAVTLTFCAALFSAAVSLTFSVFSKRAYMAILMTLLTLFIFYALTPWILAWSTHNWLDVWDWLPAINPWIVFGILTQEVTVPGGITGKFNLAWGVNCGVMLSLTLLLVIFCATCVRKAALRQAGGEAFLGSARKKPPPPQAATIAQLPPPKRRRRKRGVTDNPVLWRELHNPLIGKGKRAIVVAVLIVGALIWTYFATGDELDNEWVQVIYAVIFSILTLTVASVLAGTTITSEKESRSWDALLTTAMRPSQILGGKATGVFRRLSPILTLFFVHVTLFVVVGIIHPLVFLHLVLIMIGPLLFLVATGTYFGLRMKRTTTAVVTNMGLGLFLWALLPLLLAMLGAAVARNDDLAELAMVTNPVVLIAVSIAELADGNDLSSMRFDMPSGNLSAIPFTLFLAGMAILYAGAGAAIIAWSCSRFRELARA